MKMTKEAIQNNLNVLKEKNAKITNLVKDASEGDLVKLVAESLESQTKLIEDIYQQMLT